MRTCSICGRDVQIQGSPLTLVIYNQEFGADLMSDIANAYLGDTVDAVALLKICWAMAKTKDKELANFDDWLSSFDAEEFDLLELKASLEVVVSAINAELFRVSASTEKEKWFRRWRNRKR